MSWHSAQRKIKIAAEFQCEYCDGHNKFNQELIVKGEGRSPSVARKVLAENIMRDTSSDSVRIEAWPCVHCGYKQSWMLGKAKINAALIWGIGSLVVILILMMVLGSFIKDGQAGSSNWGDNFCLGGLVVSGVIAFIAYKTSAPNKKFTITHPLKNNKPTIIVIEGIGFAKDL